MPRDGERTADEYRAEADRVRREADAVGNGMLRASLIEIAMKYEGLARTAEMLARVRGEV